MESAVSKSTSCPACQAENPDGAKFCNSCGTALGDRAAMPELATAPPSALAQKALEDAANLEGQRRQVTVLFADMAGYTPLAEQLGEEETYRLMQPIYRQMIDAVHEFEGTVQDLAGDGLMALFGAPVAIEDAPLWACRAALALQERMQALSGALEAEHGVRPQLRIGIHTGPVVVGRVGTDMRMEFKAVGDTVNLASRLQGEAELGGVLISETTHRLVAGYVEAEDAGQREIKGKSAPQQVYRLIAIKEGVTRFDIAVDRGLTALVGRANELAALEDQWAAAKTGTVRVVDVVGEAGIGKSRLTYEFRSRIDDPNALVLRGHCTADGRATAYLPFIELIRGWFHIEDADPADTIARKLRNGLDLLGLDSASAPYLLNLLGQPVEGDEFSKEHAEIAGIRTRELLQNMILEAAAATPVLLFVDDLHWLDTASEQLLLWATRIDRPLPLMILTTYRPNYTAPWTGDDPVTRLAVAPLNQDNTIALLEERLGHRDIPDRLARLVVDKADGNPLFAEEIAGYLLSKSTDGDVGSDDSLGLPETLENLLLDRVDHLDEQPRTILQTASVVGRRFSRELISEIVAMDGSLDDHLGALERERLIFADPERAEYGFMHALVQDAIYDTLLTAQRQQMHEKVAAAIERSHAERLGEVTDLLAHHYSHTPRAEKTVRYMAAAAEKALRVYSLDEAELRLRQVIELIDAQPDCADDAFLADVLLMMGRVYYFRTDFKAVKEQAARFLPRVEALGDQKRLARFLFEIGYAYVFSGEHAKGRELLEKSLAIGEALGDDEAIGYPSMGLIWYHLFWNTGGPERRETIFELVERSYDIGRKIGDIWLASKSLIARAQTEMIDGFPGESRRQSLRLLELAKETGDPRARAMGLWSLALNEAFNLEETAAIEKADQALSISMSSLDVSGAKGARAAAMALSGAAADALADITEIRDMYLRSDFKMSQMFVDGIYGATLVQTGQMAAGVRVIEQAIDEFTPMGYRGADTLGHFILGEIYLEIARGSQKPPLAVIFKNLGFILRTLPFAKAKARRHLEMSLAESRKYDLPSFIARLQFDLGQLDLMQKKPAAAREKFTEAREQAVRAEAEALRELIDQAIAALPN